MTAVNIWDHEELRNTKDKDYPQYPKLSDFEGIFIETPQDFAIDTLSWCIFR